MLVNLGAVTLPEATADKLHTGVALTAEEVGMAARVPEVTGRILASIPRLEGVREIIAMHPQALTLGPRSPRARGCCGSRPDYPDARERGRRGLSRA